MKRWLCTVVAVFGLGLALAQAQNVGQARESYYGFGPTGLVTLGDFTEFGFLLGLQLSGPVAASLELRGTLDTVLIASNIGVDLLYPFAMSVDTRAYAGGGADFFHFVFPDPEYGNAFGLHGTAGLEFYNGNTGLYSEVQPYLLLDRTLFAIKVRAGVNVYF